MKTTWKKEFFLAFSPQSMVLQEWLHGVWFDDKIDVFDHVDPIYLIQSLIYVPLSLQFLL